MCEDHPMAPVKRTIEGRDFWFEVEQAQREDPETGALIPLERYYCTFSAQKPGTAVHGDALKDARGRAQLFPTPEQALAAGAREVEARLRLPSRAYSVGLPKGEEQTSSSASTELLRQGLVTEQRPSEEMFGRKWLHIWESREQAEQAASHLREVTRNPAWEVYDLSTPHLLSGARNGQVGPVEILVGRQSHGRTYALHPHSVKLIHQHFPQARPRATVFIAGEMPIPSQAMYDQVALLLTGLSKSQVMDLGGYCVVDPITDLVLQTVDRTSG
jgi:hypothetical protein